MYVGFMIGIRIDSGYNGPISSLLAMWNSCVKKLSEARKGSDLSIDLFDSVTCSSVSQYITLFAKFPGVDVGIESVYLKEVVYDPDTGAIDYVLRKRYGVDTKVEDSQIDHTLSVCSVESVSDSGNGEICLDRSVKVVPSGLNVSKVITPGLVDKSTRERTFSVLSGSTVSSGHVKKQKKGPAKLEREILYRERKQNSVISKCNSTCGNPPEVSKPVQKEVDSSTNSSLNVERNNPSVNVDKPSEDNPSVNVEKPSFEDVGVLRVEVSKPVEKMDVDSSVQSVSEFCENSDFDGSFSDLSDTGCVKEEEKEINVQFYSDCSDDFDVVKMPGDGWCIFHALRYNMPEFENLSVHEFRRLLYCMLKEESDDVCLNKLLYTQNKPEFWGDTSLLEVISNVLDVHICVHYGKLRSSSYTHASCPNDDNNTIHLSWSGSANSGHVDALVSRMYGRRDFSGKMLVKMSVSNYLCECDECKSLKGDDFDSLLTKCANVFGIDKSKFKCRVYGKGDKEGLIPTVPFVASARVGKQVVVFNSVAALIERLPDLWKDPARHGAVFVDKFTGRVWLCLNGFGSYGLTFVRNLLPNLVRALLPMKYTRIRHCFAN